MGEPTTKKGVKHVKLKCHKCGEVVEVAEEFAKHPRLKSYFICQNCLMERIYNRGDKK